MPETLSVAELEEAILRRYIDDPPASLRGNDPQLRELWDQWKDYGISNGDAGLRSSLSTPELLPLAQERVTSGTARRGDVPSEHTHLDNVRRRAQMFGALVAECGSEQAALERQRQLYTPIETRAQGQARLQAAATARMMAARERMQSLGGVVNPLGAAGLTAARVAPGGGDAPPPYPGGAVPGHGLPSSPPPDASRPSSPPPPYTSRPSSPTASRRSSGSR